MKNSPLFILALLVSSNVLAVEMREVMIWTGLRQSEQDANLKKCQPQVTELRVCSTNLYEHGHAAYDVVLMEAVQNPTRVISLYPGTRQSEQDAHLKLCLQSRKFGQLCITSLWIHPGAAYDVALME